MKTQNTREIELKTWLNTQCQLNTDQLTLLAGDASFRKYYRLKINHKSYVVMDAPPELEDSHSFVAVASAFEKHGLRVPKIIAKDLQTGFLVLDDLGDRLYLNQLNTNNADILYGKALDELIKIQQCKAIPNWPLTSFVGQPIRDELNNFTHWFVEVFLQLNLTAEQKKVLEQTYQLLIESAQQQPQVCIHRDYHSRNLMVLDDGGVGILDFQDAMWGPVTYDLVSLIRDCYITWPLDKVEAWALAYKKKLEDHDIIKPTDNETYLRWFDLMGMQRHLKAVFIFARKFHRDHDKNYLADIPRGLKYVEHVAAKYPELETFNTLLQNVLLPQFKTINIQ